MVRSLGTIPNRAETIRKLVQKLGPVEPLKACYEAGPTSCVLYWQLAELGILGDVIAPTLVPVKSGDQVKTYVSGGLYLRPIAHSCERHQTGELWEWRAPVVHRGRRKSEAKALCANY